LQLTIVIPTYNEAENLPKMISALFSLPIQGLNLLVVDDNSPDHTGDIAEGLARGEYPGRISVLHRAGKMGLGTAYITGFKHCLANGAEMVGQMDADFSHPVDKLVEMAAALPGCDVVIGSRYVRGGSLDDDWPIWRKALSSWGNIYSRAILGLPVRDCTGGFRLYKRHVLETLPLDRIRSNGYIFQVEMVYLINRLKFRCQEIPIHFAERRLGKSKMSLRIQLEAAIRVWQLPSMYRDIKPN
jgi:dolichol-phosphate mannosyltransferase